MNYKYTDFKHGQKVRGKVGGKEFTDGRISINKDGRVYVCQNVCDGSRANDRLGYNSSYNILISGSDFESTSRTDITLEPFEITWETLKKGDVIVDGELSEKRILTRIDECVLTSEILNHDYASFWYTIRELQDRGYTIKQPTPKVYTREEIAKALGVEVNELRIKE